ncbi:MAG: hypothetical protein COA36_17725 [Desulfotalea sp.]|nr:MAG: hypothetical protein COA36_17725 [Desulfotalea sp.]
MIRQFFFANILMLTFFLTPVLAADKTMSFKEYLEQANSYIKSYRHFEASDALKEATKLGGAKHPSLHMRLGILYYGLGLIPEAVAEGERAVHLDPASKWYKFDLAKFYYVDKQFEKSEQQFIALLKLDPGFTYGYYYLAELYFLQKRYDMGWISLQRAYKLGYRGQHLEAKIGPFSTQPHENLNYSENSQKLFRFIKLSDAKKAQEIVSKIRKGNLFENIELDLKKSRTSSAEFGIMTLGEFQTDVAVSLQDKQPYSRPQVVQAGSGYRIVQRILDFDPRKWQQDLSKAAPVVPVETLATQEEPIVLVIAATAIPKKTKSGQISSKLAAFYALEAWKDAWQNQDAKAYFSGYSHNFTPSKGLSLDAWKEKRSKSLFLPSFIKVVIEDPVVEMLTDGQLLVTFKQSYTSNSYHDVVVKTLTMEKEKYGWKIMREREIKVIPEYN